MRKPDFKLLRGTFCPVCYSVDTLYIVEATTAGETETAICANCTCKLAYKDVVGG